MAFKNSREKIIADRKIIAAGDLFLVKLASGQERSRSYDVIRGTTSGNFTNKSVFYRNLTWHIFFASFILFASFFCILHFRLILFCFLSFFHHVFNFASFIYTYSAGHRYSILPLQLHFMKANVFMQANALPVPT